MKIRTFAVAALLSLFAATSLFAAKPVLAVSEFKNETSANWWSSDVGKELSGMLTNELAATNKFRIVERKKIGAVLDEQDLAASGRVKKGTGAKTGEITGAQYLVVATVSAFDSKTRDTGGRLSFKGISVGAKSEEAYIAVDLRVINAETSEVEFTRTVEARATGGGAAVGYYRGGWSGEMANYQNTPTGKAIRGVLVEITDYLACAMVDQGGCMAEYDAKDSSRRAKTKKSIKLD
ncbi:MAG TPA: CsgG/HfaB family protein [Thermoanaerobaculia bacterium]